MESCDNIKIISLNVNGLAENRKRIAMWNQLKKSQADIILLQETHSTLERQKKWQDEMNFKMFFNNGASNARGVMVLINEKYTEKIVKHYSDNNGRIQIFDITYNSNVLTIVNLYMPTRNDEFNQQVIWNKMVKELENFQGESLIIGGDLNVYLNKEDRLTCSDMKEGTKNLINNWMDINEVSDIWRINNPGKRIFTWHRKNQFSRLDYFLISNHLMNFNIKTAINPANLTDHSCISLELIMSEEKRGMGFWKFNKMHLQDLDYVKKIKEIIFKIQDYYAEYVNIYSLLFNWAYNISKC